MSDDDVNEFNESPFLLRESWTLLFHLRSPGLMTIRALSVPIRLRDQTTIYSSPREDMSRCGSHGEYPRIPWTLSCLTWSLFLHEWYSPDDINLKSPMT